MNDVIAGAIFDFAGWVTSQPKPMSSKHNAAPMVELIQDWAAARGLSLDDPAVQDWPKLRDAFMDKMQELERRNVERSNADH